MEEKESEMPFVIQRRVFRVGVPLIVDQQAVMFEDRDEAQAIMRLVPALADEGWSIERWKEQRIRDLARLIDSGDRSYIPSKHVDAVRQALATQREVKPSAS